MSDPKIRCGQAASAAGGRSLARCSGAGLAVLLAGFLSACTANGIGGMTAFGEPATAALDGESLTGLPADQLVQRGKVFFRAQDYGNAQRAFQKAAEIAPKDAEAWLGLAASYDHLRRFDQSNIAYERLLALVGETAAYYNNRGFSYLLQGRADDAARALRRALEIDPGNVVAANNLAMLHRYAERRSG